MDGVLLDSEPLNVETEHIVCSKNNIIVPEGEWDHFKGRTNRHIFTHIVTNFSDGRVSVDDLIRQKRALYMDLLPSHVKLMPDALDVLREVRRRMELVSLTTSSSASVQALAFRLFDFTPFFDVVVNGSDVVNGKPHPEPYSLTFAKLGVAATEVYTLEDSDNGIISGREAGCADVIGITSSFPEDRLRSAGAHHVIHSLPELLAFL